STTYTNPAYGVTLKLPGRWMRVRPPYPSFCTLAGDPSDGPSRFDVMFWPIYTASPASLDDEANMMAVMYQRNAGWTFRGGESLQINGRYARILRFSTSPRDDLTLVVVKKWPATYGLLFTGPGDATEDWQHLRAALSQSIEI